MGISGLNKFLKGKNVNCFVQGYPLANLRGYRVAFDFNNFIFIQSSGVHKDLVNRHPNLVDGEIDRGEFLQRLYYRVLQYLIIFMNNGVTPIMVFDGVAPKVKEQERAKRREDKQKRKDKIQELKDEIEKTPVYLRNVKNLASVPKEMWDQAAKYTELTKELKKTMATTLNVYYDEIGALRELLQSLGIPVIVAEGEAEMCCSELSVAGEVAATFTSDTDALAMGNSFIFDELSGTSTMANGSRTGGFISGTLLKPILEQLQFTQKEFLDLCILFGTDFNTNIPNYGPVKSYALLNEHRSIEEIEKKTGLDISMLNYVECRELLTAKVKDWKKTELDVDFCMFEKLGSTVLHQYSLTELYKPLSDAIANVKVVRGA